jgi:hypothetical protein
MQLELTLQELEDLIQLVLADSIAELRAFEKHSPLADFKARLFPLGKKLDAAREQEIMKGKVAPKGEYVSHRDMRRMWDSIRGREEKKG